MFLHRSSLLLRNIKALTQVRCAGGPCITLNQKISDDLDDELIKPKNQPGRNRIENIEIPERIKTAIKTLVDESNRPKKQLKVDANLARQNAYSRTMPMERDEKGAVLSRMNLVVNHEYERGSIKLGDEANDRHELKSALGEITLNRFKDKRFERKAEVYNFTKGLQYLLGRGPMEYASIFKIFREIKLRDPQFKPQSFFDFGSGVGTGTWAAAEHWRDSLYEYFSVDQSADMNNIAEIVLRDGRENKAISLKGVFYRQFLPASDIYKSHLVLSAFTLMDLPDAQTRMEKLQALWQKCDGYLVLIENGTKDGFRLINEAREFILQQIRESEQDGGTGYLFAPCPHEMECPKNFQPNIKPCRFPATYRPLKMVVRRDASMIMYSYVVFKKSPRADDNTIKWPRIVGDTKALSRHVHCKMCTHRGQIEKVAVTKRKHTKWTYRCARKLDWGDRYPVEFADDDGGDIESFDESDDENE